MQTGAAVYLSPGSAKRAFAPGLVAFGRHKRLLVNLPQVLNLREVRATQSGFQPNDELTGCRVMGKWRSSS